MGKLGIKEIREFIINYYNEGDKILCMDDDIDDIKMKNPKSWEKSCLVEIEDLKVEVDLGFKLCEEHKTKLWGVYPCDNNMMMKNKASTHLMFCGGWLYGMIIDKDVFKLNVSQYDDYERSIKVFQKYGKVIRLNYLCAKTKYNNNKGGMCDSNRINIMKRDLDILNELYGDYIIIKKKKSSIIGVNPQIKSNISCGDT